ncbi:kinase-like domain-containing protein [Mycena sp. CBHHK59/15]|nr:kinase-like domain-containing protein [Mycena sp. CBHHK59/15]
MTPTALVPDDFHFSSMGTTDDVTRYVPGGYHPVIIGDILRAPTGTSSYRVMHKLGFGSYATVWLAEKTDAPRAFVALKIATADGLSTKEAECLRTVQRQPSSHILTLADAFEMQGPNGVHTVLVTDVAAPVLSLLSSPRTVSWRKKVAYDLANAVAQLHASGIVHGGTIRQDLYLGNVGIAMPQLAEQDPEDVMQDLDSYELTVVLPTDPKSSLPSLPAYLVVPCDMAAYYDRIAEMDDPQAKIFDFGSAHLTGTHSMSFQCALEACAPETAFARTVGKVENPTMEPPADVWALGAMIYEIMYGSPLFRELGMSALPAVLPLLSLHSGRRTGRARLFVMQLRGGMNAGAAEESMRGRRRRRGVDWAAEGGACPGSVEAAVCDGGLSGCVVSQHSSIAACRGRNVYSVWEQDGKQE